MVNLGVANMEISIRGGVILCVYDSDKESSYHLIFAFR